MGLLNTDGTNVDFTCGDENSPVCSIEHCCMPTCGPTNYLPERNPTGTCSPCSLGISANNSPDDSIVHCTNETDSVTNSCNTGFYLELSDNPEVEDGFGNCISCSNIIFSYESGVNLNSCTNCTSWAREVD